MSVQSYSCLFSTKQHTANKSRELNCDRKLQRDLYERSNHAVRMCNYYLKCSNKKSYAKRQKKSRRPPQLTRLHPLGQPRSTINENIQTKNSLGKTKRTRAKRRNPPVSGRIPMRCSYWSDNSHRRYSHIKIPNKIKLKAI